MADWYLADSISGEITASSYNRLNVDTFGFAVRFRVSFGEEGYLFTTPQFHVTFDASTSRITVSLRVASPSGEASYDHVVVFSPTITLNVWHTLVVARTVTPNPVPSMIYLDGVAVEFFNNTPTGGFGSFSQVPEMAIRSRGNFSGFMGPMPPGDSVSFYYEGEMNDLAVWRNVSLTAANALALHNAAPSTWDSIVPSPTNYWTWDNQLPTDLGSDGIVATANNFVVYDTDDFAITPTNLPATNYLTAYSQTLTAVNGGPGPYTWSISSGSLPPGLTLGASSTDTVTITGTVNDPLEIGTTYTFTVQVQEGLNTTTEGFTILVAPAIITVGSFLPAAEGILYSSTLSATGGTGPTVWTISGVPPTGLSFDISTGTLSGTPTAFTSNLGVPLTLTATREAGVWSSGNVVRYVIVTQGHATFAPLTLPNGAVGVSYSETVTATSVEPPVDDSFIRSVYLADGSLPPGLTFSGPPYTNSGTVSGTPTTPGTYTFTLAYLSYLEE